MFLERMVNIFCFSSTPDTRASLPSSCPTSCDQATMKTLTINNLGMHLINAAREMFFQGWQNSFVQFLFWIMYEVSRLPVRGYPLLIIYSYLRFRHNLSEPIAKLVIGPNNSNFYEIHTLESCKVGFRGSVCSLICPIV